MSTRVLGRVAVLAIVIGRAASASAQHEGHTMPGMQPPAAAPEQAAACSQNQQQISALIEQLAQRVEAARQTNNPPDMRAAIADLQGGLATVKTLLQPCAATALPAAGQHSGDAMEGGTAGTPMVSPGSTTPAPGAASPSKPPEQMDHAAMGHAAATTPSPTATDPVCGMKVDPAKAPKAAYKGQDYYFCSLQDREKFLKDPEGYLKRPR